MNPFGKSESHEKIYNKISSLLGISFKRQIENGPIEFYKLLHVENLITESKNYLLIFEDGQDSVTFRGKDDFIQNFVDYIDLKIEELEIEFDELNKFTSQNTGIKYDENEVYMRHERIGDSQYKFTKLKERLLKLKSDVTNK